MYRSNAAFAPRMAAGLARAIDCLRSEWRIVRLRLARQRTRRILAKLDERLLHDVGITRIGAMREAAKPFWID
jgi:uncharacterized protein YjiS (DUF1127 family)